MSTSVQEHRAQAPHVVRVAVITISDTRTKENDTSGRLIVESLEKVGHQIVSWEIVPDEPQHIRELIERLVGQVTDGSSMMRSQGEQELEGAVGFFELRDQYTTRFARQYLAEVLSRHGGDVRSAAQEAKLPRGTLYRLIKEYGLESGVPAGATGSASALPDAPRNTGTASGTQSPSPPHPFTSSPAQAGGEASIDAILLTGGTGVGSRDQTFETLSGMLTKTLYGFGEIFRMLSYQEIGPAAMLSRAIGGLIDRTVVLAMPGSTNAVRLAMEKLIVPELGHLVREARR